MLQQYLKPKNIMLNTLAYQTPSLPLQLSKSESTDDEYICQHTSQKTYKTNVCKYKTEICKNFSETGRCPYKNKCQFAHGLEELSGNIKKQVKKAYRTKKCKSFWEDGVCRYGFRCQFLHYQCVNKEERIFLGIMGEVMGCKGDSGKSRLWFGGEGARN